MTTVLQANEALKQYFIDVWGPTGHPFELDNEGLNTGSEPFARFTVRTSTGTQKTLGPVGGRKFEYVGTCFAQVFTLASGGTEQAKNLAQTVVAGFHGRRIVGTTINFRDVTPREIGNDGKWYQINVSVDFDFEDYR